MRPTTLTKEQQAYVLEKRNMKSPSQLARELGVSRDVIRRFLHTKGYPARRSTRWTPYLKAKFRLLYSQGGYKAVRSVHPWLHASPDYIYGTAQRLGVSAPSFEGRKGALSEKNLAEFARIYRGGGREAVRKVSLYRNLPIWRINNLSCAADATRYMQYKTKRWRKYEKTYDV